MEEWERERERIRVIQWKKNINQCSATIKIRLWWIIQFIKPIIISVRNNVSDRKQKPTKHLLLESNKRNGII